VRPRSTAKGIPGGSSLRRGISYFAARIVSNPPGHRACNKDCNQRQNNFPSIKRVHDYKKQRETIKSDLF
jgi:hypothetical protein